MKSFILSSLPPQNYLAEEILLGTILVYPLVFSQVLFSLENTSFFLESHQIIYNHLIVLYYNNKINFILLIYSLAKNQVLNKIGGILKIITLMKQSQIFISSSHIEIYMKDIILLINQKYKQRLFIHYGYQIVKLGYNQFFSFSESSYKAFYYLDILLNQKNQKRSSDINTLIGPLLRSLYQKTFTSIALKTNLNKVFFLQFLELDQLMKGFKVKDLIILAGRPSLGKTSFALNILWRFVKFYNVGICLFSLEMSKIQILYKLITLSSSISADILINNTLRVKEWSAIQQSCYHLLQRPIFIYDKSDISIDYIEHTLFLLSKQKINLKLVIIDYLQLINTIRVQIETRNQQLSYVTRKLKLLAQNLNVTLVVLSQLNRNIEYRVNKTPLLSDLKESGCLNYFSLIDFQYFQLNISVLSKLDGKISFSFYLLDQLSSLISFPCHFCLQYLFDFMSFDFNFLSITAGHKIYFKKQWLEACKLVETNLICFFKQINSGLKIIELKYLSFNYYNKYSTSYDLQNMTSLYLIQRKILLHNSIEQDADIVLMLQKDTSTQDEDAITLFLAKNRNGHTGSCRFKFLREQVRFDESISC
uniref:DNA 5'-3' helicase n=1 Tax=Pterocladiophila hemisphaerica TaxID=2712948 RepID=A0A6M3WW82_9FLOR|nr:dnaB [Pterocladiophila hemisphaerica]